MGIFELRRRQGRRKVVGPLSKCTTPEARAKRAEQQRKYRQRHPEVAKRYRERDPEAYRLMRRRYRATYKKRHPERMYAELKKPGGYTKRAKYFREHHPEKVSAWQAVYRAVRSGKLVRPAQCSKCKKKCRPHAHHPDYRKQLEVTWLCWPCHVDEDITRRILEQQQAAGGSAAAKRGE